ncbi:MAG: lipoate--protein ligase family protein, partial [Elusimicrobiota bacterium]
MNKKSKWRYIDTGCRSALFNMSFDKALFDSFDPDNHSPVFRLYQWSQPSISLGNFQNPDNIIDIKECESRDVQIVKRITGGGALYHNNELTYSIICSCDTFSSKSVKESYKELCGFLILTYKKLGLDPGFAVESKKLNSYKKNRHICMSGIE